MHLLFNKFNSLFIFIPNSTTIESLMRPTPTLSRLRFLRGNLLDSGGLCISCIDPAYHLTPPGPGRNGPKKINKSGVSESKGTQSNVTTTTHMILESNTAFSYPEDVPERLKAMSPYFDVILTPLLYPEDEVEMRRYVRIDVTIDDIE